MYRLKLGRIITLDPRVLTPNLDGFIPGGKTKFLTQSKWGQNEVSDPIKMGAKRG